MLWSTQSREEYPLNGVTKEEVVNDWSWDGKWLLTLDTDLHGLWLVPLPSSEHPEAVQYELAFA